MSKDSAGKNGDTDKALARFDRGQPDRLCSSLAQTVEELATRAHTSPLIPEPRA